MRVTSLLSLITIALCRAQKGPGGGVPPPPPGGLAGGGGMTCPSSGFTGSAAYMGSGAKAAPLRGAVGCVDEPINENNVLIYGPMEAGFTNAQLSLLFGCSNSGAAVVGGLDTLLAEKIVAFECALKAVSVLDDCGGHATPYHYHERMTCLYSQAENGHSTRIGTALDGNGIYGKYIEGGKLPTDLDACGGRFGITPDSDEPVYYYPVKDEAPFTIGCFGPVSSVTECRELYSTCGDGDVMTITTDSGTIEYDPDCPCYDREYSNTNVPGSAPHTPHAQQGGATTTSETTPTLKPTSKPTSTPTVKTTNKPTSTPTLKPTREPTRPPSPPKTRTPSPTKEPSRPPSQKEATASPTLIPTTTAPPTTSPTDADDPAQRPDGNRYDDVVAVSAGVGCGALLAGAVAIFVQRRRRLQERAIEAAGASPLRFSKPEANV